jgi:peptidyl-prolyl cis-trans isomerase D
MLDAMRRGALNWGAKILLGILTIAFAIWGIADVFRGYGRGAIAKLGGTEISAEEFRQAYEDEIASLSRRLGSRLTPAQIKLLGIEQRALARLVGSAALDAHARQLHLALPDTAVADLIRSDPAFRGPTGTFSRQTFQSMVRQMGFSEARYVAERRKEEIRDQLKDTLLDGAAPPQDVVEFVHAYRGETRRIDYLTPDFDKLITVPEPDEAKLKETYEANRRQFVVPESRKINALLLTRASVAALAKVSEEDVRASYEQDKDKFNEPEKRRIEQLAFRDRAAADKAYAELFKAPDFAQAAAGFGFKASDIELGLITRRQMIDPKVAEVAFSLKPGQLSEPIEGQFAVVLVRCSEIVPGKERTFADVESQIRERLTGERAAQEIRTLHDKIEDERAAGKPLQEIAGALQLSFREIPAIDAAGKAADGKPALEDADAVKIAQAAFSGSAGIDSEPAELSDGGYAWVDVLAITPEQQKPFEAVAGEVKALAIANARRTAIASYAAKLVEHLSKGETFETIATEIGGSLEHTPAITRDAAPQGLTQNAVAQAFALPIGGAASALTADGKSRTILRVAEIIPAPALSKEEGDRLTAELTQQYKGDILSEYLTGLEARFGFTVNEAALRQALGSAADRQQSDID